MSQVPQGSNAGPSPAAAFGVPSGFFASLFDMNFTKYITSSVIKFLYWLIVILVSLGSLGAIVTALASRGALAIIFTIIIVPIIWLIEIIFARVSLEIIMVIFRMSDDLSAIRGQGLSGGGGATGGQTGYTPPGNPPSGYPPSDFPQTQ
jgi:hypothetical protein